MKGGCTPAEAYMHPARSPTRPTAHELQHLGRRFPQPPARKLARLPLLGHRTGGLRPGASRALRSGCGAAQEGIALDRPRTRIQRPARGAKVRETGREPGPPSVGSSGSFTAACLGFGGCDDVAVTMHRPLDLQPPEHQHRTRPVEHAAAPPRPGDEPGEPAGCASRSGSACAAPWASAAAAFTLLHAVQYLLYANVWPDHLLQLLRRRYLLVGRHRPGAACCRSPPPPSTGPCAGWARRRWRLAALAGLSGRRGHRAASRCGRARGCWARSASTWRCWSCSSPGGSCSWRAEFLAGRARGVWPPSA